MKDQSAVTSTIFTMLICYNALGGKKQVDLLLSKRRLISSSAFPFNVHGLKDRGVLLHFWFYNQDIIRTIGALAWPPQKRTIKQNGFSVILLLATYVIIGRLASLTRWMDRDVVLEARVADAGDILGGTGTCVRSNIQPHKRTDKPKIMHLNVEQYDKTVQAIDSCFVYIRHCDSHGRTECTYHETNCLQLGQKSLALKFI